MKEPPRLCEHCERPLTKKQVESGRCSFCGKMISSHNPLRIATRVILLIKETSAMMALEAMKRHLGPYNYIVEGGIHPVFQGRAFLVTIDIGSENDPNSMITRNRILTWYNLSRSHPRYGDGALILCDVIGDDTFRRLVW